MEIMQSFPKNIELSYEIITHKKVFSCQMVMAIPEGKKYFAWFSKQNQCIFMEVDIKTKKICNIQIETSNIKCKDTILYGSIFLYNNRPFFCIEDLLYQDGKNTSFIPIQEKLVRISTLLEKDGLLNVTYCQNNITFGVPLLCPNFSQEMNFAIKELPYKIKELHFYSQEKPRHHYAMKYMYQNNSNNSSNSRSNVNTEKEKKKEKEKERPYKKPRDTIFLVKPDLQNDIYHLYAHDSILKCEYLYDTAYISDYKTSVLMNGLFRTIKENVNLDALEESDDEEEFENDTLDKYVDLKKSYYMSCIFNYKFKKWSPIKVVEHGSPSMLVRKHELSIK